MAYIINGKLGKVHAGQLAKTSKSKTAGTTMVDTHCGRTRMIKAVSCALVLAAGWGYFPLSYVKGGKNLLLSKWTHNGGCLPNQERF